jgi:hypothetical protein
MTGEGRVECHSHFPVRTTYNRDRRGVCSQWHMLYDFSSLEALDGTALASALANRVLCWPEGVTKCHNRE